MNQLPPIATTVGSGGQVGRSWPQFLERFHRERAGITEDTLGRARSHGISPYQWLVEPLPEIGRVLDLACGNGPLYPTLQDRWIGVDVSSSEVGLARRRGANAAARADAGRLPVASASFPAVACSMALMILQPLDAVLAELSRVLTPTGVAVIMVPGTFPLTGRDIARYARLMVTLRQTHLAYPNDRQLAHLSAHARGAGLSIVEDCRRRFALPLPDSEVGRLFVRSLYLPRVADRCVEMAADLAARWAGSDIGIPLRRVTLRLNSRPEPSP